MTTTPQQRRAAEEALASGARPDPQPVSPELPDDAWIPATGDLVGYTLASGPRAGELRPALVLRRLDEADLPGPAVAKSRASLVELLQRRGLPSNLLPADASTQIEVVQARLRGVLRVLVQTDPELDGLPAHVAWAAWSPVSTPLHWTPLPEPDRYEARCRLFAEFLGEVGRCLLRHGHQDPCWIAGARARSESFRGPGRAPGTSSSA